MTHRTETMFIREMLLIDRLTPIQSKYESESGDVGGRQVPAQPRPGADPEEEEIQCCRGQSDEADLSLTRNEKFQI